MSARLHGKGQRVTVHRGSTDLQARLYFRYHRVHLQCLYNKRLLVQQSRRPNAVVIPPLAEISPAVNATLHKML